ncbi:MAG: hypothetical protein HYX55_07145 [Chloroflexi bacterium]|nr:hypothetical protein [Chloroflexota bacterium]
MRSVRSSLVLGAILAFAALAPGAAASSGSSFSLSKTCDGLGTCTVVASNAAALPAGTTETYLGPQFGDPVLSSRVVIASPYAGGGTATGVCTWPLRTATGICTFAQGTGSLAGFRAQVTVSANADFSLFFWNGTYRL